MRTPLLLTIAAFALSACQSASVAPTPPAPSDYAVPGVTPSTFRLPSGTGCGGEVERFQAVMDNDLASGHTTKGVHARVRARSRPLARPAPPATKAARSPRSGRPSRSSAIPAERAR